MIERSEIDPVQCARLLRSMLGHCSGAQHEPMPPESNSQKDAHRNLPTRQPKEPVSGARPRRRPCAKAIEPGGSIIHEVGGAIMGADPRSSVVNSWDKPGTFPIYSSRRRRLCLECRQESDAHHHGAGVARLDHILERMKRKEL